MSNLATQQQQQTSVVTFLSTAEGQDLPACSYETDQRIRGYLAKDPEATSRLQDFFTACSAVGDAAPARLMDVAISLANVKGEDSEAMEYLQKCIVAHSRGVFNPADVSHAKAASLVLRKLKKHPELRAKAEGSSINALHPLSSMTVERLTTFISGTPKLTVKACREFARQSYRRYDGSSYEFCDVTKAATSPTVTSPSKEEAKVKLGTSAPIEPKVVSDHGHSTTSTPAPADPMLLDTNKTMPAHLREALNAWPVPAEKIERLEEVYQASPSFPSVEPVEALEGLDDPIAPETTRRALPEPQGGLSERSYSKAPLTTTALVDRHTVRMLAQALTVKLKQAPELTSAVPIPARQELEVQLTNTLNAIEGMLAQLQGLK